MRKTPMTSITEKRRLIKRYLIWCFKTTREEIDRIDRKFTQLEVDRFLLEELESLGKRGKHQLADAFGGKLDEFRVYIKNKETSALPERLDKDKKGDNPDYLYLKSRLSAIEKAITKFLGPQELRQIENFYQQEMIRRILEAREH
ncbi:MAG: hypothetical protein WC552_00065 [Candidatus Omnitrophota bacterium]